MVDVQNQPEIQDESKAKKSVERSAAYPSITIEDALQFVSEVYKNFRNNLAKREDIVDLIKGAHNRHVAASTYYSLLNRQKDSYQVSDLYKRIANPISEKERIGGLLISFQSPALYKEIIEKFDGDEIPKEFVIHLSRFHRITEDAAPLAAEIFIKNAKYCGVLTENNILAFNETISKINNENFQFAEIVTEKKSETKKDPSQGNVQEVTIPLAKKLEPPQLITEMVNEEKLRVPLTGKKFAYIIYPNTITKKDILILKKQLDVLDELAE